jgi:hypothetical protein
MGVTTICLGQDGSSPGGGDLEQWIGEVERWRFAVNIAPMVGHGTVRQLAGVGMASEVSPAQLDAMAATMLKLGRGGEPPGLRAARSVLSVI